MNEISSERSNSSDGDHSFSHSLDTTQDTVSPDHPLALPLPKDVATTADSSRNEKARTLSSSRKTTQSLSTATAGKDGMRSTRKQKKQKDNLFDDSDSDSDIFASSTLPLPANVAQTVATGGPVDVFDGSEGKAGEIESVLHLSDSSDDSVVMTDGQGSVLTGTQSSESRSVHLRQQCSLVSFLFTLAVLYCIHMHDSRHIN